MITVNNRCNCWKPLSIRQAVNALIDETREFVAEPSFDEFDDVKVCWNRLVGSLINRAAVNILTTSRYDEKVALRMEQHSCIRSERHLIDRRCPSLQEER